MHNKALLKAFISLFRTHWSNQYCIYFSNFSFGTIVLCLICYEMELFVSSPMHVSLFKKKTRKKTPVLNMMRALSSVFCFSQKELTHLIHGHSHILMIYWYLPKQNILLQWLLCYMSGIASIKTWLTCCCHIYLLILWMCNHLHPSQVSLHMFLVGFLCGYGVCFLHQWSIHTKLQTPLVSSDGLLGIWN